MRLIGVAAAATMFGLMCGTVDASLYHYLDWQAANPSAGTASGVITLPDASTVDVGFAATFARGNPGSFFFAQTAGGTNYWNPSTPYLSAQVENAPPASEILALVGGENQIYTVTLSEPIKDPIMAIVSLGSSFIATSYDFDSPFAIVSQGTGFWGDNATALSQLSGDVLLGTEGHGTIQFLGTFSTFSWAVPTPENWHGFTFGIRTTEALEPTVVPEPTAVPEPTSLALLGMGAIGLVANSIRRRRWTKQAALESEWPA